MNREFKLETTKNVILRLTLDIRLPTNFYIGYDVIFFFTIFVSIEKLMLLKYF